MGISDHPPNRRDAEDFVARQNRGGRVSAYRVDFVCRGTNYYQFLPALSAEDACRQIRAEFNGVRQCGAALDGKMTTQANGLVRAMLPPRKC